MCYPNNEASMTVTMVLWFFLGLFGAHRFYLGMPISGVLYLLTGGLCGIGWIVDLFFLHAMVSEFNEFHHHEHKTFIIPPNTVPYNSQYP